MIETFIAKAAAWVGVRPKVMALALAGGLALGASGTIYVQHLKIKALDGQLAAYKLSDQIAEDYAKQVAKRAVERRKVDSTRYNNFQREALNVEGENSPVGPRTDRAYSLLRGEATGAEGQ